MKFTLHSFFFQSKKADTDRSSKDQATEGVEGGEGAAPEGEAAAPENQEAPVSDPAEG